MSRMQVGSSAGDLVLVLEGEREITLAELAAGRPLALYFLRHFG